MPLEPISIHDLPGDEDFIRLPGLFRRWELNDIIELGADFHFEAAGETADVTQLIAVYRRERRSTRNTMTNSMGQQPEEMTKKHNQGGSLWLKLAGDGDKAVVVFLGEPHPREVAFVDGRCVEVGEKMKAASLRGALNVALYASKEVKVLEQGVMFFKALVRVREKYDLEKCAFEIQRHGAAKDPKTTYSILLKHQLSVEQQKVFQALPQHDLAELYSGEADGDAKGDGTVAPTARRDSNTKSTTGS